MIHTTISYLSNDRQEGMVRLLARTPRGDEEPLMDLDRVLSQLLSSPARAGLAGALAGGLLTSKGGRKLGKKALELGGAAALAGLAYSAWQRHRQGALQTPQAPPAPTPERLRATGFLPDGGAANEEFGRALFRAMVAGARADGRLDERERGALFEQIAKLELSEAERAELYAEIERPVTIDEVVASSTTPERAIELYTASWLATGADTPAERGYLTLLAARLGLDDALVASIHSELAGEPGTAAPGPPPHTVR
jgi:uncharacterized membrane protein YebE (DUF533 family)